MFEVKWTESQDDQLKALWADGWSAGKIAEAIGQGTRNAVIGRAHRLGLANKQGPKRVPKVSLRYNPSSLASRVAPTARVRVPRPAYPRDNTPLPGIGGGNGPAPFPPKLISILDLTDSRCHWPSGDPANLDTFRYCGDPIACDGKVYCECHCNLGYINWQPKARAA